MKDSVISPGNPLILASSSPRRKRLLEQVELPFRVVPSRAGEDVNLPDPDQTVRFLAREKALEVFGRISDHWTLGADTLVIVEDRVLGKPADGRDAENMLALLSGCEHRVITGFCVLSPSGETAHSEAVTTRVRFKRLTKEEISAYAATGEPMGKAGAYAIQGIGAFLVEGIFGSYTNVVGLPVCALVNALLSLGALKTFPLPR